MTQHFLLSAAARTVSVLEVAASRFRQMQFGQAHKLSPKYLDRYAHEIAYREDTRRKPNGWIFLDIARMCAHALTSRDWCG